MKETMNLKESVELNMGGFEGGREERNAVIIISEMEK